MTGDAPARWLLAVLCAVALSACRKPYRVGEFVLVDWEEGRPFPAYITDRIGRSRFRVHYDGYDCDQEVSLERIRGRVEGAPPTPSVGTVPCAHVVVAASAEPAVLPAPFKPGDHVRVTWRGSLYPAVVLQVIAKDCFLVHYEGLENAWDEVVSLERIVGRRG